MTAYQVLPGLLPDEYAALRADIGAHGVRVPVDIDENGQVLDGHHRSLIAAELGIDCPRRLVSGLSEAEKVAHAIAVNAHRRHLTQQQKRDLLAASIKAEPEASDREHARLVGTSKNTAASVRTELESTGQIDQLTDRRGADGRVRPASQPPRPEPVLVRETTKTVEEFVADRETGEVLSVEDWQDREAETADLAGATDVAPAAITGRDGKTYQPPAPRPQAAPEPVQRQTHRRPLTDTFRDAVHEVDKAVERVVRLTEDDRFTRNTEQVATGNRGDLIRAHEALAGVLALLTSD